MTQNEYLFACLAEECAEVSEQCARIGVRVAKLLRFGPDEIQDGQTLTNVQRLVAELADLQGTIEFLVEAGAISREQIEAKKGKIKKFLDYSRDLGTVEGQHAPS